MWDFRHLCVWNFAKQNVYYSQCCECASFYCFYVDMLILWVLEKEGNSLRALQQGFPFRFVFFFVFFLQWIGKNIKEATRVTRLKITGSLK